MTLVQTTGLIALVGYISIIALCLLKPERVSGNNRKLLSISALCFLAQGVMLYLSIDTPYGQNINVMNMLGMTTWFAFFIVLIHSIRMKNQLMLALISILCGFSCLLILSFGINNISQLQGQWISLIHIFASMIAMGFLLLATLQGFLVMYFDRTMRINPAKLSPILPPLQQLESLLFQMLWIGFILMNVSLLTAFLFMYDDYANQTLHKRLLSILAWCIFLGLLIGHRIFGWRGPIAAKWTISGFILLCLGYYGSKFVLEVIIQ